MKSIFKVVSSLAVVLALTGCEGKFTIQDTESPKSTDNHKQGLNPENPDSSTPKLTAPIEALASDAVEPQLWLEIMGDGDSDPVADMKVVNSLPIKPNRLHKTGKSGRMIEEPLKIQNPDGTVTIGQFIFRHPKVGLVEKHLLVDDPVSTKIADHVQDLDKYHAFSFIVRVPLTSGFKSTFEGLINTSTTDSKKLRAFHTQFNKAVFQPALDLLALGMQDKPDAVRRIRAYDTLLVKKYLRSKAHLQELNSQYLTLEKKTKYLPPPPVKSRNTTDTVSEDEQIQPQLSAAESDETLQFSRNVRLLVNSDQRANKDFGLKNRIKVAFVAEGFTAEEMDKFYQQSQDKWDYIFGGGPNNYPGVAPLKDYKNLFIGFAIGVSSNQSGACHPEAPRSQACPDTRFHIKFNSYNIPRLLGFNNEADRSNVMQLVAQEVPGAELSVVLVNDLTYGGSGGLPAMVSLDSSANEIIVHELFGHSFAKLGDEYSDPYPGYPDVEEVNTTKNSAGTKWSSLLKTLGLQLKEGAHYHEHGWYRAEESCKMKTLGSDVPFCTVCTEAIVRSIYNLVQPIDSVIPSNNKNIILMGSLPMKFKVQTVNVDSKFEINWFLDGQWIPSQTSDTLDAQSLNLRSGRHTVTVQVKDSTKYVYDTADENSDILKQAFMWTLDVR